MIAAYLSLGSAILLCGVLGAAGLSKLRGRAAVDAFADTLTELAGVPRRWASVGTFLVAGAELGTAVLLLVPHSLRLLGFASAALLLVAFTGAIARALGRGRRTPCRCFGSAATPINASHVVRNVVLFAVAVTGFGATLSVRVDVGLVGLLLAGIVGAVCALLVVRWDDLADLF